MGADLNELKEESLKKIKKETDIKQKDIQKLYQKFISLDKENKGYVSIIDLANIPEFSSHPLRYHIAQHMSDSKENDRINFETFIKLLDIFKNNKTEEQYKFMYNLFDYDKDGKISSEDMLINFKLLLGSSLTEEQILEVIDKTINEYSTDQKYIYYNDFVKIMEEV